jgi:hypothetical protein
VIAGGDFRDDAAGDGVEGDLRGDFAGEKLRAAEDRDRGFIARGFDGEKEGSG